MSLYNLSYYILYDIMTLLFYYITWYCDNDHNICDLCDSYYTLLHYSVLSKNKRKREKEKINRKIQVKNRKDFK